MNTTWTKFFGAFLLTASCVLWGAYEDVLIDFNVLGNEQQLEGDMQQLLKNENWVVRLNSSANYTLNRKLSYVKNVLVPRSPDQNLIINSGAQNHVMGIRVHFPNNDYNAYATVLPNFAIRAFGGDDGNKFVGKGIIKNVGTIKAIKVYVKGRNFPHSMYVHLQDQHFTETSYFLGSLQYDGWRELIWSNVNYLENIRDRVPEVFPIYSEVEPLIKFNAFKIFRHAGQNHGDFITYISWIKLEYDKAYIPREEDIDDEDVWQIQTELFRKRAEEEKKRLDMTNELREIELRKMNQFNEQGGTPRRSPTPAPTSPSGGQGSPPPAPPTPSEGN